MDDHILEVNQQLNNLTLPVSLPYTNCKAGNKSLLLKVLPKVPVVHSSPGNIMGSSNSKRIVEAPAVTLGMAPSYRRVLWSLNRKKIFLKKSMMRYFIHLLPARVSATPLDVLPELVMGSQPAFHRRRSVLDAGLLQDPQLLWSTAESLRQGNFLTSLGKTHAENICSKTKTGRNKSRSSKGNKEVRQLPYTDTRVSFLFN